MSDWSLYASVRHFITSASSQLIRPALAVITLVALVSAGFAQTQNTVKPQLLPNSRKYMETGLKPASGRAGSASLTARALLAKDGATTIELSTGSLDNNGSRPGNINKAQFKPLDENGDAIYARNYTGLNGGGYFNTTVNDLHRGQQVQLQGTINGIDANRMNVVTVVETVKLRPDISPSGISLPTKGVVNSTVNISAVVKEKRGDSGATVNLVLYADGVAIDRANGMWVDALGTVSCVFSHTFTSTGTKHLEVKAEGVTPGDYDLSNNSAAASIDIVQLTSSELNYNFQVVDMDSDVRSHSNNKLYINGVLQSERDEDFHAQGWTQNISFYGWTGRMISFPINVSHQETNDGASVFTNSYSNLTPTSVIDASDGTTRFISYNVWRYDPVTAHYFNLYTNATIDIATGGRTETTFFSSNRQAGDVTYYSSGYEKFWDNYSGEEFFYTWNTTELARAGWRIPMGMRYGINLSLTTGDGSTYTASPEVMLSSFDNSGQQPYTCFDWSFEEVSGTICSTNDGIMTGKHGFAYKDSNP